MSFERAVVRLGADAPAANAAAFTDIAGLSLKFVVLEAQSLVALELQGQALLDIVDRASLRFMVQRDDDATPAFAALPDSDAAEGDGAYYGQVAAVPNQMYLKRTALLQPGRYTIKVQHKEAGAGILTLNGTIAAGSLFEFSATPCSNDALVATGSDVEHTSGSY